LIETINQHRMFSNEHIKTQCISMMNQPVNLFSSYLNMYVCDDILSLCMVPLLV
jgi:hypothetical protein